MKTDDEFFEPQSRQQWRNWLRQHHATKAAVWLIYHKKTSSKYTMAGGDAVDEALCFGWIDSLRKPIDDEKFMQRFSKRKTGSTWSKVNKKKIQQLVKAGRMAPAGLKVVEAAKKNGSWSVLDEVEELIIPTDLEKAFRKKPHAKKYFLSLTRSVRRAALLRLVLAKRPETRAKRISEIVANSEKKIKPI